MQNSATPDTLKQSKAFWNNLYDYGGANNKRRKRTDIYEAVDRVRLDDGFVDLLDFGCGVGRWADYWRSRGLDYGGYDSSESAIIKAKANKPHSSFTDDITMLDTTYDVVFTCTVMIHIEVLSPIIEWIANHCRAGSRIITIETVWPADKIEEKYQQHKNMHDSDFVFYRTREEYLAAWPSTFNLIHEDQFRKNISCFAWEVS